MSNSKKINDKKIYNSVVKIINTMVELDLTIPFNVVNQAQAEGAGFFINDKGYIVTAAHVVANSVELWIRIPEKGKKIYRAEIVCVYPDFDIGIIHIKDFKNQYWLELGNSESIDLRDKVYAIGYPNNSDYPIVTSGTISGRRSSYIQTDTPINPGNSGGPILNEKNEVIGITSAVLSGSENSSLIIPINIAKNNLKSMIGSKTKVIHKNVLGIWWVNGTDNYRDMYNITGSCSEGIIVKKIIKGSPMEQLVHEGDMICGFNDGTNNYKLDYFGEANVEWENGKIPLEILVSRCQPKQKVSMDIYCIHDGKTRTIKFSLKTYEEIYPIKSIFPHLDKIDYEVFAGLIVMDLTLNHLFMPEFNNLLYLVENEQIAKPQLVITHIFPNSKISQYDTIPNYTLVKFINDIPVSTLSEFREAIKKPIVKNKKSFITVETSNKNRVILNLDEILEEEDELINLFNYKPSKLFSYFKKYSKK